MIILNKLMPNGAMTKFHKVIRFEIHPDATHAIINSYHIEDAEIISWQDTYTIPLDFKVESIADIELLLTFGNAPFAGGSIVPDEVTDLNTAKARAWAQVKTIRYNKINNGIVTPFGTFDSNETSRTNLSGAVLSALIAITAGQEFSIVWTLFEDNTVTLSGPELIQVGTFIMSYIDQCHASARNLRDQIYACDTIEEVQAVDLIAGWPVTGEENEVGEVPQEAS